MRSDPIYLTIVDGRLLSGYIEDVTAELEINGIPQDSVLMTALVGSGGEMTLSPVFDPTEPQDVELAMEEALEAYAEHAEAEL